ncbi:43746_t:CDS:2 [Gigaspora margarita]|uniref:43746_t:CDS:1 n=1 Tax=Gigaspora margarita TaxID=4874 RepID=A0ABN7UY57_GIGMA|nr:43746_t:CDS:2 [Gigaspora margarita]
MEIEQLISLKSIFTDYLKKKDKRLLSHSYINVTNNQSNNCTYKLDISDLLIHKWSLFYNGTNNFDLPEKQLKNQFNNLSTSSSFQNNTTSIIISLLKLELELG